MSQPPPADRDPQKSVLQEVAERIGQQPRVSLSEPGSEHGPSPLVDPSTAAKLVPQGRDKYQLAGEIARGGMGVILRGFDTDLGRDVAFKVLDAELAKRPAVVQRFVEEAQIGGQLQHPGIVPVYELGLMADASPYFTMKLVKGRTLAALLKQRKTPGENRARLLGIFESVCQTVAYAHSKGVLHRDLKPANIMVGAFGEVQVVDWGLAKVLSRGGVADEKRARETLHTVIETVRSGPGSSGSDSLVGSVMGTPAYMAPEQAQGEVEKLDERADVFSLGAILCEILTGRPPYGGVEGEKTVVQAARARLDPARERLDACEADPALVDLCRECLSPARDARPANADEVAQAVHAYLTSSEERAHQAELAATAAGIKAAEERRRRRLAVALGLTVIGALTLGGGAAWWISEERERRAEGVRAAVEAAHGEGIELAQAGRPAEALAAAERALELARTGDADAALLERAEGFVAKAELDLEAALQEEELQAQDARLLERLLDLRLLQLEAINDLEREAEIDADFAAAFAEYGVDLEGDDIVPALERLRDRGIEREVALALDSWGRSRRRVHGPRSVLAENLIVLAMDLDPNPERMRLREAILASDKQALLDLTAPEQIARLEAGSVWVLGSALYWGYPEERSTIYQIYDLALFVHPDDFFLQMVGGRIYQNAGRYEAALGCRQAATALKPDRADARTAHAEILYFLGRLSEAEGAYRAAIALDPESADAHYLLAMVRFQLGDLEGAHEHLQRSAELADLIPGRAADLVCVRYFLGLTSKEEVLEQLERQPASLTVATYLFALLDHPDPALREPERVLDELREGEAWYETTSFVRLFEAMAHIQLEDWEAARAALSGIHEIPDVMFVTPNAIEFMRAMVHARLGSRAAAEECYARGMAVWRLHTGGNPDAWARSDVMRWRRAAEEALAL